MQARLHLVKGNPKGKQVDVPEGTLTVGRAEDRDLIIASTRVSRQHCDIVNEAGGLTVRDNDSGNGTLVNGRKVKEQKLQPGDQVTIGPLTFLVEIDGVKEKPASAEPAEPQAEARPGAAPEPEAKPKPQAKAEPKPEAKAKPAGPRKRASEDDILAHLEQMSGGKGGGSEGGEASDSGDDDDDALEISDEDLLE
ncbi:MAG: FHA domain-containing protein [Phycisphaerae bacterium]